MYYKYLTKGERVKISEIEQKIKSAKSVLEVQLYKEQIGLILERIILRKTIEKEKNQSEK
ncbi:hypothetical protein [Bacillus sp. FJAT-27245]|uniref:hypothetical protein n=1 Tax=Bacillus sp. FJAT-27245 TaxID=1684144 RepID=UPI0006A7CB82|nr:hypothetical protein [Bacillus sp. FJAT-27245]